MMNITSGVKVAVGFGLALGAVFFAPAAHASGTITPGTLEAHCEGGATPRIVLTWTDGVNANSNSIEKGDMYPNDPNNFWAFYGAIGMETRTYTDTNVVLNQPYSYRIKYAPQVPSNVVTLTCTVASNPPAPTSTPPTSVPAPSVTLTATPNMVTQGSSAVLSWNSLNAYFCTVTPGGFLGTSATVSVVPTASTIYTATCTGAGGTASATAYVQVNPAPTLPPQTPPPASTLPPSVTLTANPAVVQAGSSATLTWSSQNATQCIAYNTWSGFKATSGVEVVTPSAYGAIYKIVCSNSSGAWAESYATVSTFPATVNTPGTGAPSVTLSANPSFVTQGQSATLTWQSQNATQCLASGGWGGFKALSGAETVTPAYTTTYTITCSNSAGYVSDTRTITVQGAVVPPSYPPYQPAPTGQVLGVGDIITGPENPVPWVLFLGFLGSLAFHFFVVRRSAKPKAEGELVRPIFIEPYGVSGEATTPATATVSPLDLRLAELRAQEGRPDTESITL